MKLITNYLTMLKREFAGYNTAKLIKDLLAGMTAVAVSLPLSLAIGVGSGASAAAGMVTAIVGGLVAGTLAGGSYQISGASGAMAAVLLTIVRQHGLEPMLLASMLAGIILLVMGVFRLGGLVRLIPLPVITGFTSGCAVIIAGGQVSNLLGLGPDDSIWAALTTGQGLNPAALAVGVAVILLVFTYPKRLAAYCPPFLAGIVLATAAGALLGLPLERVGDIPRSLLLERRLGFGHLQPRLILQMLPIAVSIAALCSIESLLCGISAGRMKNEPLEPDIDLISQGASNLLLPFFGGLPTAAALARSSVAIKAGAQTRLTGTFHSLILLLSMFAFGGVMSAIPLSALAGVLMATAVRMNDWRTIGQMFTKRHIAAGVQFLITVLATVLFNVTVAILTGVAVAAICFLIDISRLHVKVSEVDPDRMSVPYSADLHGHIRVVHLTGPLYFGTAGSLARQLPPPEDTRQLILSLRGVPLVDFSGAKALQELCQQLSSQNIEVHLSAMQPGVAQMLERCGLTHGPEARRVYANVNHALAEL